MDMTRSNLSRPPLIVNYVPIFWEPLPGTGEKIIALIAVTPNEATQLLTQPKTYITLPLKRLTNLLGHTKGTSAFGILQQAALFLSERLEAGLQLEDAIPPFVGFSVGKIKRSSGWSITQVLHAAVSSVSALGTAEEMIVEEFEDSPHIANTRTFLNNIKHGISSIDKSFETRFNKRLQLPDLPEITIDYSHNNLLVQVASLPISAKHAPHAIREAESKLFLMDLAVAEMSTVKTYPKLLINAESTLHHKTEADSSLANEFLKRFRIFAQKKNTEIFTANSTESAIHFLEAH
jgi:hypothetical protein